MSNAAYTERQGWLLTAKLCPRTKRPVIEYRFDKKVELVDKKAKLDELTELTEEYNAYKELAGF